MSLKEQIVVRVSPEFKERIQQIADADNRRPSEISRMLLESAVKAWDTKQDRAKARRAKK